MHNLKYWKLHFLKIMNFAKSWILCVFIWCILKILCCYNNLPAEFSIIVGCKIAIKCTEFLTRSQSCRASVWDILQLIAQWTLQRPESFCNCLWIVSGRPLKFWSCSQCLCQAGWFSKSLCRCVWVVLLNKSFWKITSSATCPKKYIFSQILN